MVNTCLPLPEGTRRVINVDINAAYPKDMDELTENKELPQKLELSQKNTLTTSLNKTIKG